MTLHPVDTERAQPVDTTALADVRLTTHDVCNLAGLSMRMLDFGIRAGYYECENSDLGSGSRRCFTLPQTRRVLLIAWLTSGGLTPRQAAALIDGDSRLLLAAWPDGAS